MNAGKSTLEERLKRVTISVDSIDQLITDLCGLEMQGWRFRGQRNAEWLIESSLQRAAKRSGADIQRYETKCFREFRRQAHLYFPALPAMDSCAEWVGWMQHYGIPTRLIDFTRSPYVALYFAVEDADQAAAIWAINVSRLHAPDKRDRNLIFGRLADPDSWKHRDAMLEVGGPDDKKRVEFMAPHMIPERLRNQQGEFLFAFDLSQEFTAVLDSQIGVQDHVKRFVIPEDLRTKAVERLHSANCEGHSLFPGADGVGRSLRNMVI